ncbi:hypothetical protein [Rhizobium herbae]|uniref:Uncharacterized protein n=1 Tax=Rhizobium herbae TaxID=508661 RepID=A0ABS4EHS6_9HYPH|nr:hypothetical protein [Rhizobium herbae]MBP1857495.1 hypothetical protein [Rhizobium herbae]
MKPTHVTIVEHNRVLVELGSLSEAFQFLQMGFIRSETYKDVYGFESLEEERVFRMCETLRDMNIPFSTHRMGGADYFIELFRDKGCVSGRFKRMNFFGNDRDKDAPFEIEEF